MRMCAGWIRYGCTADYRILYSTNLLMNPANQGECGINAAEHVTVLGDVASLTQLKITLKVVRIAQ